MDELKARHILGLPPGYTPEDLKDAYVRCAHAHHPEDDPEGFAKIKEAYLFLKEGTTKTNSVVPVTPIFIEPETNQDETPYDFAHLEEKAQRYKQKTLDQKIADLDVLFSRKNIQVIAKFRCFFTIENMEFLDTPAFITALNKKLVSRHVKSEIYDIIIDYYDLGTAYFQMLPAEKQTLYRILDFKRGVREKKVNVWPIFLLVVCFFSVILTWNSFEAFFGSLLFVAVLIVAIKFFVKLYEKYSVYQAQFIILLPPFFLLLLIAIFTSGTVETVSTILASCVLIYLWILCICWIISKCRRIIQTHKLKKMLGP